MKEETARVTELIEQELLTSGGVVLVIGKGATSWVERVISLQPSCRFHVFEGDLGLLRRFIAQWAPRFGSGQISALPAALEPAASGRPSQETFAPVPAVDRYCAECGIDQVDFLRVDAGRHSLAVLRGARDLLRHRRVDVLQIHLRGSADGSADATADLEPIFDELSLHGYSMFKLAGTAFVHTPSFVPEPAPAGGVVYWALSPRIKARRTEHVRGEVAYEALFERFGVVARGVVQVGTCETEDLAFWSRVGCSELVFIEGDPVAAARLEERFHQLERVRCISRRLSKPKGSPSLDREVQDNTTEVRELPADTLDAVLVGEKVDPARYNVLAMRAAGAELTVLKGARATLEHLDAILVDIHYAPPQEDGTTLGGLDAFLEAAGFERVEERCPKDLSSGQALYVRCRRLTMTTLGRNGRFANQLFQYFYLHLAAERLGAIAETPPWVGEELYDLSARRVSGAYPQIRERVGTTQPDQLLSALAAERDADLWGYFQWHTQWMAQFRDQFRSLYTPRPDVLRKLTPGLARLRERGSTLVACHLRRGDYGYGRFYVAPESWYLKALREVWHRVDRPVLYLASDDLEAVSGAFAEFRPVTARDVAGDLDLGAASAFFFDFFVLSQADVVAASNSSFSFCAAMLNERARMFLRPDPDLQKLVPFDAWNSDVLVDPADAKAQHQRRRPAYKNEQAEVEALAAVGEVAKARKRLEAFLDSTPDCGEAHNDMAVLCQTEGDLSSARAAAERAIGCDGGVALYHRNLAAILISMGEVSLACRTLERAFELDARDPENCILAGDLSALTGRTGEARKFYQTALELDPRHVQARERLTSIGMRASQPCPGQA